MFLWWIKWRLNRLSCMKQKIRWLRDIRRALFETNKWGPLNEIPRTPNRAKTIVFKASSESAVHVRGSRPTILSIIGLGDLKDLAVGVDFEFIDSNDPETDQDGKSDEAEIEAVDPVASERFARMICRWVVLDELVDFLNPSGPRKDTPERLGRWLDWLRDGLLREGQSESGTAAVILREFSREDCADIGALWVLLTDAAGFTDDEAPLLAGRLSYSRDK